METSRVTEPRTPKQIKLQTVATRSVHSGHTWMIVLQDASLQHFLIPRAKVDKAKVVCAKKYLFMNQVREIGSTGWLSWKTFFLSNFELTMIHPLQIRCW